MKYLHVRNLDKYHPGYKDRDLKFAKIFFQMVQGDPDCELIKDEIDWGRLIKFIILELQAKKPIPLEEEYLTKKGFNLIKRPIVLTINTLQSFIVVDTDISNLCNVEKEKEIDKEVDKEREKEEDMVTSVTDSSITPNSLTQIWNVFAVNNNLARVVSLSDSRKKKIKARLKEKEFVFEKILEEIKGSDFLLGKIKEWKVDFDFIIKNQNNYLKIIEGKYRTNGTNRSKGRGSIDFNKYREEAIASGDKEEGENKTRMDA